MNRAFITALLCFTMGCQDYAQPSEPVWNKQPCGHCHMLVSDPQFAAQLVTRSHERQYFDDPGCLAAYLRAHADVVEHAWVRSETGWVLAEHARFHAGANSPMGYGFVASASGELDFAAMSGAVFARAAAGTP